MSCTHHPVPPRPSLSFQLALEVPWDENQMVSLVGTAPESGFSLAQVVRAIPLKELQKMRTLRPISDRGLPGLELHYGSPSTPRAMWVELAQVRSAWTCSLLLAPHTSPFPAQLSLCCCSSLLSLRRRGTLHFPGSKVKLGPSTWLIFNYGK